MKYRPEIDGLRAVAVLPVILFHAGFPAFSGGFVGVDVFFVISGYLITTILLADLEEGRFSIARFYERRARRILPALFLVMLACLPFAWMWMLPAQFEEFGLSLIAVVLFVSNVLFWSRTGYFAPAAEEAPLLHTWSLAVEEQFYIVFPLFLLLLWRMGRARGRERGFVIAGIAALTLVSLGLAEHGWRRYPEANFYLIQGRAWELGVGALCAFVLHVRTREGRPLRPNGWLALPGLGLILLSIFLFDSTVPFPSLYALAPVGGAALIILFAGGSNLAGRVLSVRALVGIGLISYSAYLWHQPLFAFARIRSLVQPGPELMLALAFASLALAYLSWRFVEQPFRRREGIGRRALMASALAGSLFLTGFGAFGYLREGAPFRLPEKAVALLGYASDWNHYDVSGTCAFNEFNPLKEQPAPGCTDFMVDGRAQVVFVGDSHSGALALEAQRALQREGISSYAISYTGCIGLPGFYRADRTKWHECDRYNRAMADFARSHGTRVMVMTSRLAAYVEGRGFDNGEGGVETNMHARLDVLGGGPQEGRRLRVLEALAPQVGQLADDLAQDGIALVLVHPIPEAGWNVPHIAARRVINGEEDFTLTTGRQAFEGRNGEIIERLAAVSRPNLLQVRPHDVLCDEATGRCLNANQDVAYYMDDDHLSNAGARLVVPSLVSAIKKALAGIPD